MWKNRLACLMLVGLCMQPMKVSAETISLSFGSEQYEVEVREAFYIGLYIESEETSGEFEIQLSYNPLFLEYVTGGTDGGDGSVTISGNLENTQGRYLVAFKSLAGGDTSVEVTSAKLKQEEEERELDVKILPEAPVYIEPEENALLDGVRINGQELEAFDSSCLSYELKVPYEVDNLEIETSGEGTTVELSDTSLEVGENEVYLKVKGAEGAYSIYTISAVREEEKTSVVNESKEIEDLPQAKGANKEGVKEHSDESEMQEKEPISLFVWLLLGIFVFLVITYLVILVFVRYQEQKRKKRRLERKANEGKLEIQEETEIESVEQAKPVEQAKLVEQEKPVEQAKPVEQEPVISVQDVCMYFKIATQNVSGIKELVIQKLKGKISYRQLKALDHVSFDVMHGEVVGIIGTNGSGKSTLLKIVSGALSPTSGKVIVDRSKVQLLTLGTGFDMELTARENVYLNGAIIGYTREFIDEKYDDIVKFAELEGFMEEKVKNFSSGMVSRLGFAIATIADTPEILILDEVLSVGDEFFRKKSLKRIKEMIHSGSTVLMVSHGMGTILDNCTKAVWIEKGELKMIGEPKVVCGEYRKYGYEK